jgi:hypothetical protein
MDNNQKASMYGRLLDEHTRIRNRISEIKSQYLDLPKNKLFEIKDLESKQLKIMNFINKMLR